MATTTTAKPATKVITGKVRLSYPHIWEPATAPGSDKAKYSASLIISKKDKETLAKIEAAVQTAIEEGKSKWGGKVPKNLKLPLRDGDIDRDEDEAYKGSFFLNANATRQPGVLDKDKNEMMDKDQLYAGCYVRASLSFYAFDSNGNRGIGVGLNNIMKVAEGDPLSGRASAEEDFAEVEAAEDDFDA